VTSERATTIRRFFDAFNRRDFESLIAEVGDDTVLEEWVGMPGSETFRGRDGVRRAFESWFESWEWLQASPNEIEEAGGAVLVTIDQVGRGSASGAEVSLRSWSIYEFDGSTVTRITFFTDHETVMAAWKELGLERAKTTGDEEEA
jgi:ketosteroid isomerase-like protein